MDWIDCSVFIVYRQWSMNTVLVPIASVEATTWAGWFHALGDPTRILILHLLATEARPMTSARSSRPSMSASRRCRTTCRSSATPASCTSNAPAPELVADQRPLPGLLPQRG